MASTTGVQRLEEVWRVPSGLASLTAVNHRTIGIRYIVTALIFFAAAGVLALMMLIQLSRPEFDFLPPELYNQFFTMHGTTMMFLFAVPIMEGIGIYLVPLMIGARDMAYPRLNAFGYYVYLIAGLTLYASLFLGVAPDAGWFNYTPLSGPEYSPGPNIDFYAAAITFLEIAALVAAIELIVTILKLRAPGMSISKMPLFVWAILVMAFQIIFAMPPLMLGSVMLALDRMVGTAFFNEALGGSSLLWQHLFWFFGHPEVYIIVLPAFGVVSMVIPTFARRTIVGYLPVAISMIAIGIIGFGLWVHHMFGTEISIMGMSLFAAASMAIAIPSGVQIFAWIGTLWDSAKIVWSVPLLWVVGFVVLFVIGGITGVMLAVVPFNWQVHDTQFVTAHFHYVLVGGAVFPLFGGIYYWFPKVTGRLLNERLGRWSFWLAFIGFNVAFFIMHLTGFMGMPRRVHTYLEHHGFSTNMTVTLIGAVLLATGFLLTFINMAISVRGGERAGPDPWEAPTLEWATDSPPPSYNFERIPVVASSTPLWDDEAERQSVEYYTDRRETLGTSLLDGNPEQRVALPTPSVWPLLLAIAVAVAFIGSMIDLIFVPIGAVLSLIAIVGWAWPGKQRKQGL